MKIYLLKFLVKKSGGLYRDVAPFTSLDSALEGAKEQCGKQPIKILELKANKNTGMFISINVFELTYDKTKKRYVGTPIQHGDRGIEIDGYIDTWGAIDIYKEFALMEHDEYGDQTCYLVINRFTKQVICETYDGLITALDNENLL